MCTKIDTGKIFNKVNVDVFSTATVIQQYALIPAIRANRVHFRVYNSEVISLVVKSQRVHAARLKLLCEIVESHDSLLQAAIRFVSRSRLSREAKGGENFNGYWLLCSYRVMLNLCLVTACLERCGK